MLADQYPRALQRLQDAASARVAAIELWNQALETEPFGTVLHVGHDGTGSIRVYADWTLDERRAITDQLRAWATALWETLDELVRESVDLFAALHATRDLAADRYFPLAVDEASYQDLLEAACIDGVLRGHAAVIRACQPFTNDVDPVAAGLRSQLARLLVWTEQLDAGAQISAWASPETPEIHPDPPVTVMSITVAPAAEVTDSGIDVARFSLAGHQIAMEHQAAAGTYIDPFWPGDPAPTGPDDHMPDRMRGCERAVLQIAAQFAALSDQVDGARSLLPAPETTSRSSSARVMTETEADTLRASQSKVALVVDANGTNSIVIATPGGLMQRTLPRSSTLRAYRNSGVAAEAAVRDAVATWGLADFAMRPPKVERKGAGVREIGDGIVLTGDRGLIVQVKRRDAAGDDQEKEHRWIGKQIEKACRQVDGSHRRLSAAPTKLVNGRGTTLTIDTTQVALMGVVIIDHPDDSLTTPLRPPTTRVPTVVLSRRDWEFLFNQLRSTRAVVDYLFRVERSADRLHDEPARYYELAVLDAAAPPNPPNPLHDGIAPTRSTPQLPLEPMGVDDPVAHGLLRLICEDIATMPLTTATAEEIVEVLATLDGLHVSHRADLGRLLLTALKTPSNGDARPWQFRTFLPATAGKPQLAFGTCSKFDDITESGFRSWLQLRHQERAEREDFAGAVTIGVLLTPRRDGLRDWDTTLLAIRGDLDIDQDTLTRYRALWGPRGRQRAA